MDQKRLFLAIAISVVILAISQILLPHPHHPPVAPPTQTQTAPKPSNTVGVVPQDAGLAPVTSPHEVPRVKISADRVQGSISLVGARLDDLVLRDFKETLAPDSPLVRLFEPKTDPQPYYAQFGWSALSGNTAIKLPGSDTLWTASSDTLSTGHPVTLSWSNGQGQTFEIALAIDDNYMFTAQQTVRNTGAAALTLTPWARILRGYTPKVAGYYILHEGLIGVLDGKLEEMKYSAAKSDGEKHDGVAFTATTTGGWAGITDKYWLAALVPAEGQPVTATFRTLTDRLSDGTEAEGYQTDFSNASPITVPPAGDVTTVMRLFAGAKEVHLLDHYEAEYHIPSFWKAVDFGWFWFITRPFFYAIDWLYRQTGNFGVAILIFTAFIKLLFFPLANYSYRSMSKMKLLAPKMTALREQYKDEPQKLQGEMMRLYKLEKVNPASGCLPMLVQIPVFFSLYKVIFVTIEMRQAPFFGWIRDLSAVDPTNVFNLFGLLPFDPTTISPLLHLGAWPLIMGFTMWGQQRLNPPPPDPMQAKLFQFMPLIFTFMLARFPAGLVIYWTWNNLLTICQQWLIMRQTKLSRPSLARTT
jgi:YidC/Oxa1 family membrane protein insertase